MIGVRKLLCGLVAFAAASGASAAPPAHTFRVEGDHFAFDGKPFVVHSGEMHYPRIPRPYWRDRFRMARAMGLNTICTYVFWNLHERTPGHFDFTGNLDLAEFVREAGEEGLKVIVRPGPYVCTEWDFGGLPSWLLKDRTTVVRSRDAKYLAATERYLRAVGAQLRPLLPQNGGPLIMAQVENEYGSYGSDHAYMAWVRDTMRNAGFDLQLYTSDGPGQGMLAGGTLPDLPATVNFGGGAEGAFRELAKFRSTGPRMIGEYWAGWFDAWGKGHQVTSPGAHLPDLEWCLKNDVSFNLYMFAGGTNFGFMAGANGGDQSFTVDTTSYDYDAPLDESGRVTPKYAAFRELLQRYSPSPLPAVPASAATITIPRTRLSESTPLFANLPTPVRSKNPMTFEELDQAHGLVLYRTRTQLSGDLALSIGRLGDYATVFVNGRRAGTLDRRLRQVSMRLVVPAGGATIDLLVEKLARVNFGGALPNERKGIDGHVTLQGQPLEGWEQYRFPLENLRGLRFAGRDGAGPRFYRGTFNVAKTGDTFLDTKGWNKGFVWVNGHNLGRFWFIGPQRTLYLPGVWLRAGANEVVVYDDGERVAEPNLEGLSAPLLDEVWIDPTKAKPNAKAVSFAGMEPVATVTLPKGPEAQTVRFAKPISARYVAIEIASEAGAGPWSSLAELDAFGPDGKKLDRRKWRIAYVDSEELDAEDGAAKNVLDGQPGTIWHTEYGTRQPKPPHVLVVDLGEQVPVAGLTLLPRQVGINGRFKAIRVFASPTAFPMK